MKGKNDMKMNIENVTKAMKFNTVTSLYKALGLESVKGKQRIVQDKEIARYLSYEKTGKVLRGKVTNEIVITEIFAEPKDKVDNRENNKGGNNDGFAKLIMPLLYIGDFKYSLNRIITDSLGLVDDKEDLMIDEYDSWSQRKYKTLLKGEIRKKVDSAFSIIEREGLGTVSKGYMISYDSEYWEEADDKLILAIDEVKAELCKKYGFTSEGKIFMYPKISKAYVKELNNKLKSRFGIEKLYRYYNFKTYASEEAIMESADNFSILQDKLKEKIKVLMQKQIADYYFNTKHQICKGFGANKKLISTWNIPVYDSLNNNKVIRTHNMLFSDDLVCTKIDERIFTIIDTENPF